MGVEAHRCIIFRRSHHSAKLIALDPADVAGTTRPVLDSRVPNDQRFSLLKYGEDDRHLSAIPSGTEKHVVLFPRSYLLFEGGREPEPFNFANEIKATAGQLMVGVIENHYYNAREKILYDLDWRLNVISAKPMKAFQDKHWERFQKGTIDHVFSQKDIDQLEKNVVVVKYPRSAIAR